MVNKIRLGIITKIAIPLIIVFSLLTYFTTVVILNWFAQAQITVTKRHALDTVSEMAMVFDVDTSADAFKRVATILALNEHVKHAYIINPLTDDIVGSSQYRHAKRSIVDIPALAKQAYEAVLINDRWFFTDIEDSHYALAYPVSALNVSNAESLDYIMVVYFDNIVLQNQFWDYKKQIVGASTVFLLFLVSFTYLLLFRFIQLPVRAFQKAIEKQTQGEQSEISAIETNDEFGDLSREFVRMRGVEKHSLKIAREAANEAQNLANKKSQFLANMSHEIRTPINGILGLAQLCKQAKSKQEIDRNLAMLSESTQLLLTVVNDVLDYSKLEKHGITIHKSDVVMSKVIANVAHLIEVIAHRKGLVFNIELANLCPYSLSIDAKRLQQVLLNILNNALKFTQCGSVSLFIDFEWRNSHSGVLSLRVKDTGIGISSSQRKHLFEPFEQVDNSVSRDYGGTGLGLAISKELVELMGGVISVSSELGQGSEFTIILPCDAQSVVNHIQTLSKHYELPKLVTSLVTNQRTKFLVDVVNSKHKKGRTIELNALAIKWDKVPFLLDEKSFFEEILQTQDKLELRDVADSTKSHHVLLAEDNEINAIVQSNMLKLIGCKVRCVKNGHEAVIAMSEENIDLILMDVQMPVLDGIEATKLIRKIHSSIPIIGLSANTFEEDKEIAIASGMNEYLHKPILQEELAEALQPYFIKITNQKAELQKQV